MTEHDDASDSADRRRFLKAIGALGITGLAGCSGDGDDETPTESPTDGTETTTSPGETTTAPDETTTAPNETTAPPDTGTPGRRIPEDDPAALIALSEDGISPEAETLNATITNPYLFDIRNGSVELEGPEGWELTPSEGTEFDTLASQSTQDAVWEISIPEGADGNYQLTASVTYGDGVASVDVETGLAIFVNVWSGNDFTEVAHFEDFEGWDGIEDRMWAPPTGENPDWGGFTPKNWYKFELDMSAFLPADKIQFEFTDPYTGGGWGPSVWDARLNADGEEIHYHRTVFDDEEPFLFQDSSQVDTASEDFQAWRFADAQNFWVYEFEVPDDPDELVAEFTIRNGFRISARSFPSSDATKDDVDVTRTPAVRVPYTGDSGGGVDDETPINTPSMPPRQFLLSPEDDLPHGPTANVANEGEVDDRDDISAEVYTGYDEDNLYLRIDVTDDTHVAVGGENMWQVDSVQVLAGNEEYGPEYGIAHVDGATDTYEWFAGGSAGIDAMDATTTRTDGESLTQYELTIPWGSLYTDFAAEPGDNAPFGLLVNEADTDNGERDAWLGWPQPTPGKEISGIGTLLLENFEEDN